MAKNNSPSWVYAPLMLTILIDSIGFGLVFPIFASLFGETGGILPPGTSTQVSDLFYGITMASFPIGIFLGAPLLGELSDHWGRKKVLLLCLFGEGIGMWLCALAISYKLISLIIISRLVTGLLAGSMGIAQAAVIDISTENKKAVNLSLIAIAGSVGFALGPVVGSYLTIKSSFGEPHYSTPFLLVGTVALLNGALLMISLKETSQFSRIVKIDLTKSFKLFISGFSNKKLRYLAITLFLLQSSWVIYFLSGSLFMEQVLHYDLPKLGNYISTVAVINGFTLIVIIRLLVKVFETKTILFWASILMGGGMILASIRLEWISWVAIAPAAIGFGLIYVTILSLFSDAIRKEAQGWAMGIASSIAAAAVCFASVLSGVLPSWSFLATFLTGAILSFFGALIVKKRI